MADIDSYNNKSEIPSPTPHAQSEYELEGLRNDIREMQQYTQLKEEIGIPDSVSAKDFKDFLDTIAFHQPLISPEERSKLSWEQQTQIDNWDKQMKDLAFSVYTKISSIFADWVTIDAKKSFFWSALVIAEQKMLILDQISTISHKTSPIIGLLYNFFWELGEEFVEWIAENVEQKSGVKERFEKLGEKRFTELWTKEAARLQAQGMNSTDIERARVSFKKACQKDPIVKEIFKSCLGDMAKAVPLFMMGLYIHSAPDKKKALIEYGTFMAMSRIPGIAWGEITLLAGIISKTSPKLAPIAKRLEGIISKSKNISKKWWGTAWVILMVWILIGIFSIPWFAEQFNKGMDWTTEKIPDNNLTDAVFWVLGSIDVPLSWIADVLAAAWVTDTDPTREQMTYMQDKVGKEYGQITSASNIPIKFGAWDSVGGDNIMNAWDICVSSASENNIFYKKLAKYYQFNGDYHAWWQRQMVDFYAKHQQLKAAEDSLEKYLQDNGILQADEHLSYLDMASAKNKRYSELDLASVKPPSNQENINFSEDNYAHPLMFITTRFFGWWPLFENVQVGNPKYGAMPPEMYQRLQKAWEKKTQLKDDKDFHEAQKNWEVVRKHAKELAQDVDVYSYLGVYDVDKWTDIENPTMQESFTEVLIWNINRKHEIQLSQPPIQKEITDLVEAIPTDNVSFLWDMMEKNPIDPEKRRNNTDIVRTKKALVDILSLITQGQNDITPVNELIQEHIANLIIMGRQVSYEEILNATGHFVEHYFKNIYKQWDEIPSCIRDYIPQPKQYSPTNTPPDTTDKTKITQWYTGEIEKFKWYGEGGNFTQLKYTINTPKNITISRPEFTHDKITLKQSTEIHGLWVLYSEKYGALSGYLEFHQAVAMANLSLYYAEFINHEVHERKRREYYGSPAGGGSYEVTGDATWKSENGIKKPFYYKEDKWLVYAKDEFWWLDQEVMKSRETGFDWVKFYTKQLNIAPNTMVNILNTYFEKIGPELKLIWD